MLCVEFIAFFGADSEDVRLNTSMRVQFWFSRHRVSRWKERGLWRGFGWGLRGGLGYFWWEMTRREKN